MKSLLYKEFAESKKWLLACLALSVAVLLFSVKHYGSLSIDYMIYVIVFSMLARNMGDDEKSGWEKYSRALPNTAIQRVGARYAFLILVMLALTLIMFLSVVLRSIGLESNDGIFGEFMLTAVRNSIPTEALRFSLILIGFALAFPMGYVLKGQVRAVAIALPIAPLLFISLIVSSWITITNGGYKTYNFAESISKPQFIAMIVASSLLLFVASYFISVIIETRSGREKLKAVKVIAAVLTVAAVAVSGVTVYALNKDGAFEKDESLLYEPDYEDYQELEEEWERKNQAAREETYEYVEALCGETLVDKKIEDIRARLGEIGFGDCFVGDEMLYSADKPLAVYVMTSDLSATPEYPETLSVATQVQPTVIKTLDAEEKYEEIDSAFIDGMPEADAVIIMKSYDLCPEYISENLDNGKPYRNYRLEVTFENALGDAVGDMSLSIDIIDGVIHDVRSYYYDR